MIPAMNVLACIGLLCLVATVYSQMAPWRLEIQKPQYFEAVKAITPLKPPSKTTPTTASPAQTDPYCNNGTCAGVPYETILNSYRGLFFTKEELQKKLLHMDVSYVSPKWRKTQRWLWGPSLRKRSLRRRQSVPDGDRCCPTARDFMYPLNITCPNSKGELFEVVQLWELDPKPMYQLIHRGLCKGRGRCSKCNQKFALHSILVVNDTGIMFKECEIESYCSCNGYFK